MGCIEILEIINQYLNNNRSCIKMLGIISTIGDIAQKGLL